MARRVMFSLLSLLLAGSAFWSADPVPDVNLFGVMFLFFAFIVWFYWPDIEAGLFLLRRQRRTALREVPGCSFIRFAPMYLRELSSEEAPPRLVA